MGAYSPELIMIQYIDARTPIHRHIYNFICCIKNVKAMEQMAGSLVFRPPHIYAHDNLQLCEMRNRNRIKGQHKKGHTVKFDRISLISSLYCSMALEIAVVLRNRVQELF